MEMSLEPVRRSPSAPVQRAAATMQPLIDQVVWYDRPAIRWEAFRALFNTVLEGEVSRLRNENHAELTRMIATNFAQFNREFKDANVQMGQELWEAMVKADNPFTEAAIKRQWDVWIEETSLLLKSMAREV